MASLTHVCMWSGKGWTHITAAEAARIHPRGTVSAHSGLFMCELCGQYVLLTDTGVQIRHFRHSSSEKSKDCPERTFGSSASVSFNPGEHELPIRICHITSTSFDFEMGFIRVPNNLISAALQIEIKPILNGASSFFFSKERLNGNGITYLPIGDMPCSGYQISVSGASEGIRQFWPKSVSGIDPEGSIFDASNGRKLVTDSDVTLEKKYFLLQRKRLFWTNNSDVSIKEVCRKRINWDTWYLYEVYAKTYNETSARFFLDFHCRLTDTPVSLQTVWPLYVDSPYVIKHNQKSTVLHISGNAPTTRVFPNAAIIPYKSANATVQEIFCNSRQQLISSGRTKALQYTYFWQEPLGKKAEKPIVTVTDIHGVQSELGINDNLPKDNILRISAPYDGLIKIRSENNVVEKRKLQAGITAEITVTWGQSFEVYVGLDQVWKASFVRKQKTAKLDESIILQHLRSLSGEKIQVSHTIGAMAAALADYPEIRKWLLQCIRNGYMSRNAYMELKAWIVTSTPPGKK